MANYLCVFAAPDAHIDFIRAYPNTLYSYVEGRPPQAADMEPPKPTFLQRLTGRTPTPPPELAVPDDWPTDEPTMIGPEINHRNAGLYHLILNGTTNTVRGSGTIFQTWCNPDEHAAIDLTGNGEHFAFRSHRIPALVRLLRKVDSSTVRDRFGQWLRTQGESDPADEHCKEIAAEFRAFADAAQKTVDDSHGLIWISC